ncbi:FAD binding domain-containing protein [Paratractidigestivibacter sp.]|uniref:FAD binding domain-containing protein n=1 Tax=Paratractidigestivibacter sp. TaxID=2847316 RepID=UPI002ABD1C12|nr:FAD binding domain-containing protein [Paratractidigestivibacter sp.]
MLKFEQYVRPDTPQEAFDLLQENRLATIIGGMMWLRLSDRTIPVGIDLSGCGLNTIEETDGAFIIGAMVTLGQLENHEAFKQMTRGVFTDGVHDIIGTQFRNLATVGGSAYARMGFSDIVTALLPLDTWCEFTGAGTMRFADFVNGGAARDVLERIVVKKHDYRASFQCLRNSATDFSTLNVCAALWENEWHLAVGARPKKAKFLEGDDLALPVGFTNEQLAAACENARYLNYGTDRRGSAEYRAELAEVLSRRAIQAAAAQSSVEEELARAAEANKPRGISQ